MRLVLRSGLLLAGLAGLAGATIGAIGTGGASLRPSPAHVGLDRGASPDHGRPGDSGSGAATATPIKHLVVIFDENVSFDHYFGTYPYAANPPGEPSFTAAPGTPSVNGLYNAVGSDGTLSGPLLTANPNGANPFRLDRSQPMTCDQNHGYTAEQAAADLGAEDGYPQNTGKGSTTLSQCLSGLTYNGSAETPSATLGGAPAVMGYYDGNTVTALWNYAQHFAMSDNAFGTTYGPSTPGALNVTSAQTYGSICGPSWATINDSPCTTPSGISSPSDVNSWSLSPTATTAPGSGTDFSDADPNLDVCSYAPKVDGGDGGTGASTIEMSGPNIGTALDAANISWGWFQGGFADGYVPGHGTAPTTAQVCSESHQNVGGSTVTDYIPHHEPFQYYAATANPMHLPPTSVAMIGHQDQANHQYGLADFWAAADSGNLPAVSFLKAAGYQDGHAGYSDPLDEQKFLVDTINGLEKLPSWSSTAVVITWDDSDGWYDHVLAPIVTASSSSIDALTGPGACGPSALVPTGSAGQEQGKCGLGPRLPFLVISPYARPNYVDNTLVDQSSVVRFIEDNWGLPRLGNGAADAAAGSIASMLDFRGRSNPPLFLNDTTGEPGPASPESANRRHG